MAILLVLLIHWLFQTSVASQTVKHRPMSGHRMEEFLKPMRSLQIILRPEWRRNSRTEANELAVTIRKALDYLSANDVPIQIFPENKRTPTLYYATRHVPNRVSWLLFSVTPLNSDPIPMALLINSCIGWSNRVVHSVIFRDLINVVVINLRSSHAGGYGFDLALPREIAPFYFMVFEWVPCTNELSDYVWAFDVSDGETSHRIVNLPEYFKMAEQEGIDAVVKHVNLFRKDFHGERLLIHPHSHF